jgi:two-component system phosphate regulon response regulator OmpR
MPAAIILDINMPGEDGLSALRRLRTTLDIPVIMLTAAGEVVDRIVGLELGADDYLGKPVDLRELEARLKAVLRRTAPKGGEEPP